ncbi:hypothetical protein FRX31_025122 [Thalictrum thalictroides]|uniref:Uncharacterized protein n=1 Tax=Thalictrum thalictroides TaxID=46969 RepID=A0A7J6VL01_THATH|nr:hypothetical protein FRX31_025122 [Thalictrum thalictroides]
MNTFPQCPEFDLVSKNIKDGFSYHAPNIILYMVYEKNIAKKKSSPDDSGFLLNSKLYQQFLLICASEPKQQCNLEWIFSIATSSPTETCMQHILTILQIQFKIYKETIATEKSSLSFSGSPLLRIVSYAAMHLQKINKNV